MLNLQAKSGIAIYGGLSTPNDKMSEFYNKDKVFSNTLNENVNLLKSAAATGYHIGARYKMPLSGSFVLHGGIGWNRFPQSDVVVTDPSNNKEIATLQVSHDIFPVNAGLSFYLINKGIGVYALGELTYNYFQSTTNYKYNSIGIPLNLKDINTKPSNSRIGAGIGAGMDLNVLFATIFLEAKYNMMNIIAKDDGEPMKSYFTLSVGLSFGGNPTE